MNNKERQIILAALDLRRAHWRFVQEEGEFANGGRGTDESVLKPFEEDLRQAEHALDKALKAVFGMFDLHMPRNRGQYEPVYRAGRLGETRHVWQGDRRMCVEPDSVEVYETRKDAKTGALVPQFRSPGLGDFGVLWASAEDWPAEIEPESAGE